MTTKEQTRGSQAEQLTKMLRRQIIGGVLGPGKALRQEELASQYNTSRMPIREALRSLNSDGLVQLIPNRGAIVSSMTVKELMENIEMREAAELLALRLAIPHLSNAQIEEAMSIQTMIAQADLEGFGTLNKRFHLTLYEPCERPRLLAHISSLHDIAERYMLATLSRLNYISTSSHEHHSLLDACFHRNEDDAQKILSKHIVSAGKVLIEHMRATN